MKVQMLMDWTRKGEQYDCFWKIVDMPSLPPIGCMLHFDHKDLDCFEVKCITWNESRPNIFQIELSAIDTGEEDAEVTIDWMRACGWTHESERPSYEALT